MNNVKISNCGVLLRKRVCENFEKHRKLDPVIVCSVRVFQGVREQCILSLQEHSKL
jgi:hypothetical protein